MGKGQRQYTDKQRAAALIALRENAGNVTQTSALLGIPRATLIRWRDEQPSQSERVDTVELSEKHQAFIDAYFANGFNQTLAYMTVYESDNYAASANSAYRLMKNDEIQDAIAIRMTAAAMKANEAIARLATMARGDLADLLNEDGTFDFAEAKRRGTTYLIREYERIEEKDGKVRTKVKLEDRQAAITTLIKELHLKANEPTELSEHTIKVQPVDYREAIKGLAPKDDE